MNKHYSELEFAVVNTRSARWNWLDNYLCTIKARNISRKETMVQSVGNRGKLWSHGNVCLELAIAYREKSTNIELAVADWLPIYQQINLTCPIQQ